MEKKINKVTYWIPEEEQKHLEEFAEKLCQIFNQHALWGENSIDKDHFKITSIPGSISREVDTTGSVWKWKIPLYQEPNYLQDSTENNPDHE